MKGYDPRYLNSFDEKAKEFLLTGHGRFFFDSFLSIHGEHCYVTGPTGAGKTNKGMHLVYFLKQTETVIWISSGKDNETLPLLFMGKPVRIITPKYHDVKILEGKEPFSPHPEIVTVPDPGSAWWAVKKGQINIFEFRNAFWDSGKRIEWMIELFSTLATWTRLNMMPHISPAAIFMDESKWLVAGTRVTTDGGRVRASDIITENAMDIRAYGFRLVVFAQGYSDIPPAMRDNLPCFVLCSGTEIEENKKLRLHCNPSVIGWKKTSQFKLSQAKFVDRFGNSSPSYKPWDWPLYPKSEEDRERCMRMRVKDIGFHDQPPTEAESEEELFPQLGRFSHLAIPPEKENPPEHSRYDIPGVSVND